MISKCSIKSKNTYVKDNLKYISLMAQDDSTELQIQKIEAIALFLSQD